MCKMVCYGEQEGGTGFIGTGGVTTRKLITTVEGESREISLWLFVSPGGIEKSLN